MLGDEVLHRIADLPTFADDLHMRNAPGRITPRGEGPVPNPRALLAEGLPVTTSVVGVEEDEEAAKMRRAIATSPACNLYMQGGYG